MSDFSRLEEELTSLRVALAHEKEERQKLDEECDLLAFENDRLKDELARLKATTRSSSSSHSGHLAKNDTASFGEEVLEFFVEGDGKYANSLKMKILDANGGKNVLCAAFMVDGEVDILLSGGVDGALNGYDSSGIRLFSYMLSAPVLAIDVNGLTVACSLMDGGHAVIELSAGEYEHQEVAAVKEHSKYVVAVKFSADGMYLATASHDKSVNVYKRNDSDGAFVKAKTIHFTTTPESILFVYSAVLAGYELIIGLRESAHLVYLDCTSLETQRLVSLNEQEWDTHVSYTPLHLSTSPDGKLLLIATDRSLHYVVHTGTNKRVRVLAGHSCGDYGKSSVAWDCTGRYIYCNSDEDSAVYIYSLASERVVGKLNKSGHKAQVRGVACHPTKRLVVSASYDKSIILWENAAEESS